MNQINVLIKKDSDITRAIAQIIYYAPYKTILSSATMPDKCDLPKTIKLFEENNKELQLIYPNPATDKIYILNLKDY